MSSKSTKFRSCFIVDVSLNADDIVISDSTHMSYHIDPKNQTLRKEFTDWFKRVFQAGKAQTLTIFSYEIKDVSECESELHIVKFLNPNETDQV